jgi:hypothetical protein
MSNLSLALQEAYAMAKTDVVIINTLEIRHVSITDPIAQAHKNIMLTLETGQEVLFEAMPFVFTPPQTGENGIQELTLAIDNIDLRVSDFVEVASMFPAPVEVLYRPYLESDPTTPQMIPPLRLFLKDVTITATQVSARATMGDLINRKFPRELYTRDRFPSIGDL